MRKPHGYDGALRTLADDAPAAQNRWA